MYYPVGITEEEARAKRELEYSTGLKERPAGAAKAIGVVVLAGFFLWMVTK